MIPAQANQNQRGNLVRPEVVVTLDIRCSFLFVKTDKLSTGFLFGMALQVYGTQQRPVQMP